MKIVSIIIIGCTLAVIAYYQIFTAYFVAEDWEWFRHIENINLSGVYAIFLPEQLGGIKAVFWRPIIPFTFWINYFFSGFNPLPYHLTNFLFHLGTAFLIYIFALFIFNNKQYASAAFLLFTVFPYHSEAVSWIDGRYDVIMTFFVLSSLICFLFFISNKKITLFVLSLFFYLIALLTKEHAIVLPLVLTSYLIFIKYKNLRGLIKIIFPYLIVTSIWLFIKIIFVRQSFGIFNYNGLFISRLWILYFILSIPIFKYRKYFNHIMIFTFLLLGILMLPIIFFPTEERYLYLPSIAFILFLVSAIKAKYFIKQQNLVLSCFIFLVISSTLYLQVRNRRWVRGGEIAQSIITQAKKISREIDSKRSIYIVGLPDNYEKAFLFRTHVSEAFHYNGISQQIFQGITTDGIGQIKQQSDLENYVFTSTKPFVIFRPRIINSSIDVIEISDGLTKTLFYQKQNKIKLTLSDDFLQNKPVILYFDGIQLKKAQDE